MRCYLQMPLEARDFSHERDFTPGGADMLEMNGKMLILELLCIWVQNESHLRIMPRSPETFFVEE